MTAQESTGASPFEMNAYEIARLVVQWAEHDHPGNDWWGVEIARRHIDALLTEIDRLRAHNHAAVEGCHACMSAEAMARV